MTDKQRLINKLNALVARLREEYKSDPNIQTIGWGNKKTAGKYSNDICLIFYVHKKLSGELAIEAAGSKAIPKKIEGYPTDVIQRNMTQDQTGSRGETAYDPLVGGGTTNNAEGRNFFWISGGGTLGMLVRDADSNAPMALSNWHVWADGGEVGDTIIQPSTPRGEEYAEGVATSVFCPGFGGLIRGITPSPIASGLYAGAAVAGTVAAASDYRDPSRRGQDQTPVPATELTLSEEVDLEIEYSAIPGTGTPFQTKVKWDYKRNTNNGVHTYQVEEENVNTQFLLGQMITTDKTAYRPGEVIKLDAAIWDYQDRPCDAYHVVAHLISQENPDRVIRTVLRPAPCPRTFPQDPGDEPLFDPEKICGDFSQFKEGLKFPRRGIFFGWLRYRNLSRIEPTMIVKYQVAGADPVNTLLVPEDGFSLRHSPATWVGIRLMGENKTKVGIRAYNSNGALLVNKFEVIGASGILEVELSGADISRVIVFGDKRKVYLHEYCIEEADPNTPKMQCIDFNRYNPGSTYPYKGSFEWLGYLDWHKDRLRILQWGSTEPGLYLPDTGLSFSHEPASKVRVSGVNKASGPIVVEALKLGVVTATASVQPGRNGKFEVTLEGEAMANVLVRGGSNETLIYSYCILPEGAKRKLEAGISEKVAGMIRKELPDLDWKPGTKLKATRCCFSGKARLPAWEQPGKWNIHLIVQNVNHVPDGTPPEKAAVIIGGHIISQNVSCNGCEMETLTDYAFEVI